MCGRYYVDEDMTAEVKRLLRGQSAKEKPDDRKEEFAAELSAAGYGKKDVCPSDRAWVLLKEDGKITMRFWRWGFPGFGKQGGLLINARAETLLERPVFQASAKYRRCIIPARGYYEWNKRREKAAFHKEKGTPLFLAGIYDLYEGEERFVIVTTEANESVRSTHHRMPLIFEAQDALAWLEHTENITGLLRREPEELCREQTYEQISLEDCFGRNGFSD